MLRVYENLVFWDIGANSGVYSLIVHMLKPQSIVIAFEPSSYCRTKIISNCKLNNFSYSFFSILDIENSIIYVSDLALGSTNEKKLLNYYTIDDNYTYGGRLTEINKKSVNTEVINITRAENLINLNPKILPDVIKIDIEGYEYLALSGFGVYIKKLKFILVEILSNEMASKLENIFPPGDFRYYSIDDRNHFVENRSHLSKSPSRNWAIVRNDQQPALGILNSWN
jgi:FkbM family methyltransferase